MRDPRAFNAALYADQFVVRYVLFIAYPRSTHKANTLTSQSLIQCQIFLCNKAVLEHQKYTTIVTLTYQFLEEDQIVLEPNARISICHDVRTAEVLSHCRRKRSRIISHSRYQRMPDLHRKWKLNRFLQKWLGFCHMQGHLFLKYAAWQYPC